MSIDFKGIQTLYGESGLHNLKNSYVLVVGIGGVGSWSAETLARSGVGRIGLVDLDEICLSNINRQIHTLTSTVGKSKTSVMKKRILEINPTCEVVEFEDFLTKDSLHEILKVRPDYVIDAIDSVTNKAVLVDYCYKNKIPSISVGEAGGKTSLGPFNIVDLNLTIQDKLLMRLRKKLKNDYRYPKHHKRMKIEVITIPVSKSHEGNLSGKLDCAGGLGSIMHVTATFGILAAGHVINKLGKNNVYKCPHTSPEL